METNKELKLGSIIWFKPSVAREKQWGFIKSYLIDTNKEHYGITIHTLEDTKVHRVHFGWKKGVRWDVIDE